MCLNGSCVICAHQPYVSQHFLWGRFRLMFSGVFRQVGTYAVLTLEIGFSVKNDAECPLLMRAFLCFMCQALACNCSLPLPFPSLPFPSLPFPSPSLPFPSLPFPSLPFPSLPFPSLSFPSLSFPSLPFPFPSPFPSLPFPFLSISFLFPPSLLFWKVKLQKVREKVVDPKVFKKLSPKFGSSFSVISKFWIVWGAWNFPKINWRAMLDA